MRYTLKDVGLGYKKIYRGTKWVGRVAKCEDGRYIGVLGTTHKYAATESEAFEAVVLPVLGHATREDLSRHNANVRAQRAQVKAHARKTVDEMLRGDFSGLDKLFGIK